MRRFLNFDCEGHGLAATLDDANGTTGLLIVSGGNEIRIGASRGMERLAGDLADAGYPVFRFDRCGIGDSTGENRGFEGSAADIRAAVAAFRAACPHVERIVAFGNCDAATALLLHKPEGLSALVLSNIWVIEPVDDLPPPAAIKSHYMQRLKDPKAWRGLVSGAVDIRKLFAGLRRLAEPKTPSALLNRVAMAMAASQLPAHILLASKDGTALAFAEAWASPAFQAARANAANRLTIFESDAHSFTRAADYALLKSALIESLSSN